MEYTQQQKDLAAIRRLALPKDDEQGPKRRVPRTAVMRDVIIAGVRLDPERPILAEWSETPYTRVTSTKSEMRNGKWVYDAGDGMGVSIGEKHKVRSVAWPTIGEVREVSALDYELIAREAMRAKEKPRFEPVPKETKVRGPILPPNFPSSPEKARRIVATATRKAPEELTLEEMITYFEKAQKAKGAIFKL
jgi:hypothetical protein